MPRGKGRPHLLSAARRCRAAVGALPPRARHVLLGIAAAALLLVPAGLWLRDSSLVAVDHVKVVGATGPQAPSVRRALVDAAERMTTLHVRRDRLLQAVAAYPIVRDVAVSSHLPHTLRITVRQHVPVGALALGPRRTAVAADGTVLTDTGTRGLPLVPVRTPPGGSHVVGRRTLALVALLGAAPGPLRAHVSTVLLGPHGLTARLTGGPELYFGPGRRLAAKWRAAARVLADPSARGARYLDLRVAERPAAGGLPPPPPTVGAINPQPQVEAPVG